MRVQIQKSDDLTQTNPKQKRFRLTGMLVQEVSLVDRAANGHRFLIVKNQGDNMKKAEKILLSPKVKSSILQVLKPAAEKAQELLDMVDGAQEEEAAGDMIPPALAQGINEVCDAMSSIASGDPAAPAADPDQATEGQEQMAAPKPAPAKVEEAAPKPAPTKVEEAAIAVPGKTPGKVEEAAPPAAAGPAPAAAGGDMKKPEEEQKGTPPKPQPTAVEYAAPCADDEMKKILSDVDKALTPAAPAAPAQDTRVGDMKIADLQKMFLDWNTQQAKPAQPQTSYARSNAVPMDRGTQHAQERSEAEVFDVDDLTEWVHQ